jgi:hypothetical protein
VDIRHGIGVVLVAAIAAAAGTCVASKAEKAEAGNTILHDYGCPSGQAIVRTKNFHTCLRTF